MHERLHRMKSFAETVNDAISELRCSKEYEPGQEVAVLVPLKSKCGTAKGVNLDDVKIEYFDNRRLTDEAGNVIFDIKNSGYIIARVTGKIR